MEWGWPVFYENEMVLVLSFQSIFQKIFEGEMLIPAHNSSSNIFGIYAYFKSYIHKCLGSRQHFISENIWRRNVDQILVHNSSSNIFRIYAYFKSNIHKNLWSRRHLFSENIWRRNVDQILAHNSSPNIFGIYAFLESYSKVSWFQTTFYFRKYLIKKCWSDPSSQLFFKYFWN